MDHLILVAIIISAAASLTVLITGFLFGDRPRKLNEMEYVCCSECDGFGEIELGLPECPEGLCDGDGELLNIEVDETGSYPAGTKPCPCRL